MKVPLCKLDEIPEEGAKTVDFFGREVLIFQVDGKPKAVLNICMHLGGPMKRKGDSLVCQWHGAEFDCRQGKCVKGPAHADSRLITLPTQAENEMLIYVYGK